MKNTRVPYQGLFQFLCLLNTYDLCHDLSLAEKSLGCLENASICKMHRKKNIPVGSGCGAEPMHWSGGWIIWK